MAPPNLSNPGKLLWPESALPVPLLEGEVHLWSWTFQRDQFPSEDFAILSQPEQARTKRFRFPPDQVRYCICHSHLRRILGSYLGQPAESLRFIEGPGGKPELDAQTDALSFNLSHSKSLAVLAVSRDVPLGVDVEDIRPIEPAVARRYFSAVEFASLDTLTGPEWLEGFYRCWTRKEAILKAEGTGLSTPLDSFDVSLLADQPAVLLSARPESKFTQQWRLHHLFPAEGTMGALAVNRSEVRLIPRTLAHEALSPQP